MLCCPETSPSNPQTGQPTHCQLPCQVLAVAMETRSPRATPLLKMMGLWR
uniref:Uncharacterized protein n=1 Tax=Amphimedon queenslandica TaxID=400682 RepID=A0A1X7UJI0_AMPQE